MLIGAALVVAIVAAYLNSLDGPFVFDDALAIPENPTIRRLWPLTDVLFPPRGEGLSVEGRPVLNLTLALNFAIGGTAVRGYHVVNVAIHSLAALTLFGLVRRTLVLPRLRERFGRHALPIAAIIVALWSLHPLQTESVTYVIQRAESLVGLFYLLTLYCFVRGAEQGAYPIQGSPARERREKARGDIPIIPPPVRQAQGPEPAEGLTLRTTTDVPLNPVSNVPLAHARGYERERVEFSGTAETGLYLRRAWFVLAVLACAIGMATKEVMVSAPLLVLIFDRAFVTGTLWKAWRRRWRIHLALFSTWILLAALVIRTGTRGGTAGFGIGVTPFDYALTQFEAVTRYIWLSLWPHPLVFDYGVDWVERAIDVLPFMIAVGGLVAATIVAWWRWPATAFLGFLFFAVLSPTSSIVPGNRQTLAEHRMYLPLAAITVLAVCGVHSVVQTRRQARALFVAGAMATIALGGLTVRRNFDYRSELALYHDTAIKRPSNGFARYNLAKAYAEAGRHAEALPEYEAGLRLMAEAPGIHYNLANSLAALGRRDEAVAHYEAALQAEPNYARAHFNLGNVLLELGRKEDARAHFAATVAVEPSFVEARVNLGGVLLELGGLTEARGHFEDVLRHKPEHVLAHFNLANVCLLEQRWEDAIRHFEKVIALRPDLAVARERLEMARMKRKR